MPGVSVVIPSGDTSRSDNLMRLLDDVRQQSEPPDEVEVVSGVSPNGLARNQGAARTRGDVLVFLDDDVRLGTPDVLRDMAAWLRRDAHLGMVGTSQLLPPDSSAFQRRCAAQISRSQSEVVPQLTDSDMVTTQCCAMRRDVFEQVGHFHDRIIRGVDPDMRNRVRQAHYRICVVPNAWHYHPMPASLSSLLRMGWRNGHASAFARKHFPDTVIFNPEGHVAQFEAQPGLISRILRNGLSLSSHALRGQWYGALYDVVYLAGYFLGR